MRGQSGDKNKIRLQAQVCSGRARTLVRQTHWSLRSAQHGRKTRAPLREGGGHREDSGRRGGRPEPPSLNSAKGTERGTRGRLMSLRAKSAGALTAVSGRLNRAQFRVPPALCPKPPALLAGLSQGLTGGPAFRLQFPPNTSQRHPRYRRHVWQSPLSVPIFLSLETVHSLNLQACS